MSAYQPTPQFNIWLCASHHQACMCCSPAPHKLPGGNFCHTCRDGSLLLFLVRANLDSEEGPVTVTIPESWVWTSCDESSFYMASRLKFNFISAGLWLEENVLVLVSRFAGNRCRWLSTRRVGYFIVCVWHTFRYLWVNPGVVFEINYHWER